MIFYLFPFVEKKTQQDKIEEKTKKLLKNTAVSGVIYFSVILVLSYLFMYPTFMESLRYTAVSTLIDFDFRTAYSASEQIFQ